MCMMFTYDDVCLLPAYSTLPTRDKADTSVAFLGKKFELPVIPSNMVSVINEKIARKFSENNHFYIMHRFGGDNQTLDFLKIANEENWETISISVGVNEPSRSVLLNAAEEFQYRIDYITIDVAHGHHEKTKQMIQYIKCTHPHAKIIAGNVATQRGVKDLQRWGADAIKVGVGSGSICTTRLMTGFGSPMFSCIQECATCATVPLIADGGAKHFGDIGKALTAGATMVMSGSWFASCVDSPAEIVDGKKLYYGSTSFEAKREHDHIEGRSLSIESNRTYKETLHDIKQALQSSISYAGGDDLTTFETTKYRTVKR